MHRTQFSEKIAYGGFSQIQSQFAISNNGAPYYKTYTLEECMVQVSTVLGVNRKSISRIGSFTRWETHIGRGVHASGNARISRIRNFTRRETHVPRTKRRSGLRTADEATSTSERFTHRKTYVGERVLHVGKRTSGQNERQERDSRVGKCMSGQNERRERGLRVGRCVPRIVSSATIPYHGANNYCPV